MSPEIKISGTHDPKHLSGLPGEETIAIDCFLVLPEGKGTPCGHVKDRDLLESPNKDIGSKGGCMYLDLSDCFCLSRTSSKSGFEGLLVL